MNWQPLYQKTSGNTLLLLIESDDHVLFAREVLQKLNLKVDEKTIRAVMLEGLGNKFYFLIIAKYIEP